MKTRNKVLIGGAVVAIAYFLWDRSKKKKALATNGSSNLIEPAIQSSLNPISVNSTNDADAKAKAQAEADAKAKAQAEADAKAKAQAEADAKAKALSDAQAKLAEQARLAEEARLAEQARLQRIKVELEKQLELQRLEQQRIAESQRIAEDERLRQLAIQMNIDQNRIINSSNGVLKILPDYESSITSSSVDMELFAPQEPTYYYQDADRS